MTCGSSKGAAVIDEFPPIKWLDKKQYVRVDPKTGLPQLIRVEPVATSDGQFVLDKVAVFVDSEMTIVNREAAEEFIRNLDCTPLEDVERRQGIH
jgi:hypothetical protein